MKGTPMIKAVLLMAPSLTPSCSVRAHGWHLASAWVSMWAKS